MDVDNPSPRSIVATIGAISVIAILMVGLMVMFGGGQTSTILSNVGAALPADCCQDDTTHAGEAVGGESSGGDDGGGGGQIADAAARPPELLIIRTGHLELEVADVPSAVAASASSVDSLGGYVSSSDEASNGEGSGASVVYRIPADRWDDATTAIRSLAGRVDRVTVETEAVTNQVIDLDARIANLRATEGALQAIMAGATRIPDVLEVQGQLTTVRGEIEQLVAQKAGLEERAAFGTLTVSFHLPVIPAVEEVSRGWDPAGETDRAVGTLIGIAQAAIAVAIWATIVGLPILGTSLALVLTAWAAWRLIGRRRAADEAGAG